MIILLTRYVYVAKECVCDPKCLHVLMSDFPLVIYIYLLQVLLVYPCRDTVYLETPSTQPVGWSPMGKVVWTILSHEYSSTS